MTLEQFIEVKGGRSRTIPPAPVSSLDVSLIIPTFNEAGNIETLLRKLQSSFLETGVSFELVVVDDDSPDRTWKIALELTKVIPELRVIRRKHVSGLATAVICGWSLSQGKILGVIDGDGQHPADVVPQLLKSLHNGAEIAVASRNLMQGGVSEWPTIRRVLSGGAQALGQLLLPGTIGKVTDPMSGYFFLQREIVANTDLDPVGYKILLEVLARCEIENLVEVPYTFQKRESGHSKVAFKHYLGYLRHLLRLRIHPLRSQAMLRYLIVTASALLLDAFVFVALFEIQGWNLTRSAAIAGEAGILLTILLHDLWTFAGRPARNSLDRFRRLLGVQIALGGLLFMRLALTNALVNWLQIDPLVAFIFALTIVMPGGHLLGSRFSWRRN